MVCPGCGLCPAIALKILNRFFQIPGAAGPGIRSMAKKYFFADVNGRHTLCKMPSTGGNWEPLADDTVGSSRHGPYADPDGRHLWYHCYFDGLGCVYKLPLDGDDPVRFIPRGFEDAQIAHATRARNGCIAFDSSFYNRVSPHQ